MSERFKGHINRESNRRNLVRLFESKKRVGVIENVDPSKQPIGTSLQLFVLQPRTVSDKPGVFLSISNGAGQCFTRLSPPELEEIIQWMQHLLPNLQDSFSKAVKHHGILRDLEREYQERISTTESSTHREEKAFQDKYYEEESLKELASKKPFQE